MRPPGIEPDLPSGLYPDQEQSESLAQVEETFIQDEDEEGFPLSEEEEEEEEEEEADEYEDEELDEEQVATIVWAFTNVFRI